ncbi:hypothetical protein GCK32_011855 [Trichostrongylus colubriformis]|uniref:Uncharacterized protein n=1 Tax=Trichostrongylus colubriformis TaxID=6319 RepID=A0AAN8FZY0_TRICO
MALLVAEFALLIFCGLPWESLTETTSAVSTHKEHDKDSWEEQDYDDYDPRKDEKTTLVHNTQDLPEHHNGSTERTLDEPDDYSMSDKLQASKTDNDKSNTGNSFNVFDVKVTDTPTPGDYPTNITDEREWLASDIETTSASASYEVTTTIDGEYYPFIPAFDSVEDPPCYQMSNRMQEDTPYSSAQTVPFIYQSLLNAVLTLYLLDFFYNVSHSIRFQIVFHFAMYRILCVS